MHTSFTVRFLNLHSPFRIKNSLRKKKKERKKREEKKKKKKKQEMSRRIPERAKGTLSVRLEFTLSCPPNASWVARRVEQNRKPGNALERASLQRTAAPWIRKLAGVGGT